MLAREGYAVVIGDLNEELGKSAAKEIETDGGAAAFAKLDVGDEASWNEAGVFVAYPL